MMCIFISLGSLGILFQYPNKDYKGIIAPELAIPFLLLNFP